MHVWILSPYESVTEALCLLVEDCGFHAWRAANPKVEVALSDLSHAQHPYPNPPGVPTLALVAADGHVVDLLHRGYRGYLRPTEGREVLKQALEVIRRGELWAERHVLARTIESFAHPRLTAREDQIYRLISKGLSNRAVAERLSITERTVKAHASRLYEKLGVSGRVELIVQARNDGVQL